MPRKTPRLRREQLRFRSRSHLESATARLLDDPAVDSCSIDVPNLLVEVGLAAHAVQRQQDVADWRQRYRRRAR